MNPEETTSVIKNAKTQPYKLYLHCLTTHVAICIKLLRDAVAAEWTVEWPIRFNRAFAKV